MLDPIVSSGYRCCDGSWSESESKSKSQSQLQPQSQSQAPIPQFADILIKLIQLIIDKNRPAKNIFDYDTSKFGKDCVIAIDKINTNMYNWFKYHSEWHWTIIPSIMCTL